MNWYDDGAPIDDTEEHTYSPQAVHVPIRGVGRMLPQSGKGYERNAVLPYPLPPIPWPGVATRGRQRVGCIWDCGDVCNCQG